MATIYLDYAATTPIDRRVAEKMWQYLNNETLFGNPSSLHTYGQAAREAIELARAQVASIINADPSEIIWTSGATESINTAIKGVASLYERKGKHIVTMQTEHKAALDTCMHLEKQGYQVSYLKPHANGLVDFQALEAALREDTILVSIMHVNNETGVIQDIDRIAALTASRNIFFHMDAVQSIGKLDLDVRKTPIDLISMCAHKVYGPKGIGALYLRKKPRVRVAPLIHGGGHEQGMRSGTLATHQIVGMGEAFYLAQCEHKQENSVMLQLRDRFLNHLLPIKNLKINADLAFCIPHILNVRFQGMIADAIITNIPSIAVSTASACQGMRGSHVLAAMGLNEEQVKASIRFSFGRLTTTEEIDEAAKRIRRKIYQLCR